MMVVSLTLGVLHPYVCFVSLARSEVNSSTVALSKGAEVTYALNTVLCEIFEGSNFSQNLLSHVLANLQKTYLRNKKHMHMFVRDACQTYPSTKMKLV